MQQTDIDHDSGAAAASERSSTTAGRMRVVTWNVWWRFGPAWRQRQRGLLTRLREADADVVALQECWGSAETTQADEFGAQLDRHAAFVAPGLPPAPVPPESPDQDGVQIGIGLLSRWPVVHARAVPLPARHRTPAPVALTATLAHPAGRLHIVVGCLEWETAYNDDRLAQGVAFVDLATDPACDGPLPVIACGDLNAAPDSPVLRPAYDALSDAWIVGGGAADAVTLRSDHPHAALEVTELIDQRIDHIFFRPGQPDLHVSVEHVELLGEPVDGLDPSDHKAVCCDITWAPAAEVQDSRSCRDRREA